uniref:Uncharacterized protein n=1 Tax=Peromyscus maniculatus bairdii TaxID=230844 RepID=A0A8C8UKD3_PERMB
VASPVCLSASSQACLLMTTLNSVNIILVNSFLGEIPRSLLFFLNTNKTFRSTLYKSSTNQIFDSKCFLLTICSNSFHVIFYSTAKFLYYLKEKKYQ